MALVARALLTEFPERRAYFAIHAIQIGGKVLRNYNRLIDRYPGATGMKTGFICASGYNVVASATRNGRRLIVVILGAYSGGVRAQHAAQLLETGFRGGGLSWLTPSLGTVDALAPIDAQPPNLREEMCGGHRRKPPSEDNDEEEETTTVASADGSIPAFMLSSLQPSAGKFVLGPAVESRPPIVVFTGPAEKPDTAVQTAAPKKKRAAKRAKRKSSKPKPKVSSANR
jgi:D-alanyl-D-alanine carboxypeptidase